MVNAVILSVCNIALLSVSFTSGTNLLSVSVYFDSIKTDKNINMSIVMTSSKASSIFECLSRDLHSSLTSVKSFYFDERMGTCYYNNNVDDDVTMHVPEGSLYYCRVERNQQPEAGTSTCLNCSSCVDVYDIGYTDPGVYSVRDPGNPESFVDVYCRDGWTVFQRRIDGSENFYRGWTDYVNGFGNQSGEFWLGLDLLNQWTSQGPACELYIYLRGEEGNPYRDEGFARYPNFAILDSFTNYALNISGYTGDVSDALQYSNGFPFTTLDNDNDASPQNCAVLYKGAWWYKNCHVSNLNGQYLNGTQETFADGIQWTDTWTNYYSLIETEMRFKCT